MVWHNACDIFSRRGLGFLRPASRPDRIWRKCHGYLRRSYDLRCGPARAVLCAGEHLRQHRQLADHRLQADRHQLPRSDPGHRRQQSARRQRHHRIARDQHGAGRRADRVGLHLHGDQRQRLLRGAEARQLQRQPAGVFGRRQLHPPRRLCARQERLPGQRRGLLCRRRSDRSGDRQHDRQRAAGAEIRQRLPAGGADIGGELSRQPGELSADHQARQFDSGVGTAAAGGFRVRQSALARHACHAFWRRNDHGRQQK